MTLLEAYHHFLLAGLPLEQHAYPMPCRLEADGGSGSQLDFLSSGWHWRLWDGVDYSLRCEESVSYGK